MPLDRPADWYRDPAAVRVANILLSYQTPAGGWSKNLDFTVRPRVPGERFSMDNLSHFPAGGDYDEPVERAWNYVGTFDNDATIIPLSFLAKSAAALGKQEGAPFRRAFLRGVDYVLSSQYPNGGWPQVWPLQGGYHDAITFNDNAMVNILRFLRAAAAGQDEFSAVPPKVRAKARSAFERGLQCVLATQVVVNGLRTVWAQQHDPLTLQPVSARNYEMPALSGGESADLLLFLMELSKPGPEVEAAIHAAAAWFQKTQIQNVAYERIGEGRKLVSAPGAGPLWARYYQVGTDRPIFGDRDKSIHDDVNEISQERRNGYRWYLDNPKRALEGYATWSKAHSMPAGSVGSSK
jgi:PelA/Pel-15E family pectate lyase